MHIPPSYSEHFNTSPKSLAAKIGAVAMAAEVFEWKITRLRRDGTIILATDNDIAAVRERLIVSFGARNTCTITAYSTAKDMGACKKDCTLLRASVERLTAEYDEPMLAQAGELTAEEHNYIWYRGKLRKDVQLRGTDFFHSLFGDGKTHTPLLVITALNCAVALFMIIQGAGFFSFDYDKLIQFGASSTEGFLRGEYWRLFTSVFQHDGLGHLLMNTYGLLIAGILLEEVIGARNFYLAYVATGIIASLTSVWWHFEVVGVGASGAIFGLYGMSLGLFLTGYAKPEERGAMVMLVIIFAGINLLSGLKAGIDNAAHLGGMAAGFVAGLYFYFPLRYHRYKVARYSPLLFFPLLIWVAFLLLAPAAGKEYKAFEAEWNRFEELEDKGLAYYHYSGGDYDTLAMLARDSGLVNWKLAKETLERAAFVAGVPDYKLEYNGRLMRYADLRIECFTWLNRAYSENTGAYDDTIRTLGKNIDALLDSLNNGL